jgi:transcriptional regulator with XRE-family HTH domain
LICYKIFILWYKANIKIELLLRSVVKTDQEYLVRLGQAIKERRKELRMSQADLAFRIGLEVPNLSVIENGKSNPQVLTLVKIACALDIELGGITPGVRNFKGYLETPTAYVPRKHKTKK